MQPANETRPPSRTRLPFAAAVLLVLCALVVACAQASAAAGEGGESEAAATGTEATKPPPNFVVIQTDDQTLDELYAAFTPYPGAPAIRAMPNTLNLLAKRGMTFNRYYVSYPLCCPSRVTLLTGR